MNTRMMLVAAAALSLAAASSAFAAEVKVPITLGGKTATITVNTAGPLDPSQCTTVEVDGKVIKEQCSDELKAVRAAEADAKVAHAEVDAREKVAIDAITALDAAKDKAAAADSVLDKAKAALSAIMPMMSPVAPPAEPAPTAPAPEAAPAALPPAPAKADPAKADGPVFQSNDNGLLDV